MKKILSLLLCGYACVTLAAGSDEFAFESRGLPLSDVAAVIGKQYGLSIFFASAEAGAKPVNGNLVASSETDALRVLRFLSGVDFRREGAMVLYGGAVTNWRAVPAALLTQEQVTKVEGMSIIGGYAVFKGDELLQRNLSALVGTLTTRRSGQARLLVVDVSDSRADALDEMLGKARVEVSLSGSISSPNLDVILDFKSILDFLKTDTTSSILIDQQIRLTSGEPFTAYNGRVRERPIYIRPEYSENDLVTSYDKTQLGFTLKIEPVWMDDEWQLRYHIEDSDYIEELRKTSFGGVERIREGERKQIVSLRRNTKMKVTRGVPVFRAVSKRAFTWTTVSGENRTVLVFLEVETGGAAGTGAAPAATVPDAPPLPCSIINNSETRQSAASQVEVLLRE